MSGRIITRIRERQARVALARDARYAGPEIAALCRRIDDERDAATAARMRSAPRLRRWFGIA